MFLYEAKEGFALWKDFTTWFVPDRQGFLSGLFGGVTNSFLKYDPSGLTADLPLIPGAPLLMILTVAAISTIGIIVVIRKKKLR